MARRHQVAALAAAALCAPFLWYLLTDFRGETINRIAPGDLFGLDLLNLVVPTRVTIGGATISVSQALARPEVRLADLADAGLIFGTGFAPFRGGPLRYQGSHP